MSTDLETRALDLALVGAPPTGDAELDAAVARAAEDIAAIRAGLGLIADELPVLERWPERRPRRRLWAAIAVVVVAAAIAGWVTLGGGGPGSRSSSPGPWR